jgi:hypothetical protein
LEATPVFAPPLVLTRPTVDDRAPLVQWKIGVIVAVGLVCVGAVR